MPEDRRLPSTHGVRGREAVFFTTAHCLPRRSSSLSWRSSTLADRPCAKAQHLPMEGVIFFKLSAWHATSSSNWRGSRPYEFQSVIGSGSRRVVQLPHVRSEALGGHMTLRHDGAPNVHNCVELRGARRTRATRSAPRYRCRRRARARTQRHGARRHRSGGELPAGCRAVHHQRLAPSRRNRRLAGVDSAAPAPRQPVWFTRAAGLHPPSHANAPERAAGPAGGRRALKIVTRHLVNVVASATSRESSIHTHHEEAGRRWRALPRSGSQPLTPGTTPDPMERGCYTAGRAEAPA